MKKSIKALVLGLSMAMSFSGAGFSQFESIGTMLSGGQADATMILTEYMRPFANSLGANLNAGWYTSAKVHQTFGFHLNITASIAFAPDDAKFYDLDGLTDLTAVYDKNLAPTFFGEETPPTISYQEDIPVVGTQTIAEYPHPKGVGIGFIPSPMINAGFGLPKGIELLGRYMPPVKFKGIETGLWGVGIKHDVGQWIPFIKRVPVLHFSVMYGYTNVGVNAKLGPIVPADVSAFDQTTAAVGWDDQAFEMLN